MSKEEEEIERAIERLHLTKAEQLLRQRDALEEEIRERARKEISPVYILELIRFQRIPDLLEFEESTLMHLKLNEGQFFRVLQLMKLIDDPEYIRSLSKLPEVSESAKFFIEKQLSYNQLITNYSIRLIEEALKKTGGNKAAAARLLHLNRTTLHEIIKKYGIETPPESPSNVVPLKMVVNDD